MRRQSKYGMDEKQPEDNMESSAKIQKEETVSITSSTDSKRPSFFRDYILDYISNSNLHGLKYIGEEHRTFPERVFWLFAFICCVVLCSGLIRKVWIKWNESPVIVSFAENTTPVWQIPYPAVTVCLETKAKQTVYNFTEYYHLYNQSETRNNLTDIEREIFEDLTLVCDDHLSSSVGRKTNGGNSTIVNLKHVAPNITDTFFGCKWKDHPKESCSDLFSPILTDEGICYTFNTLRAEELLKTESLHTDYEYIEHQNISKYWTLDEGYDDKSPVEVYPHRGSGYGAKAGLVFLMKNNAKDLDYLCRGPVQGFKIRLHNPAELPRLSQQYFRSPLSQEVVVAVKPKMMSTSSGLRPYDPERRQCFFPSERYLRYFKVYTQANCELECLTNFTYSKCGCVHIAMPHSSDMEVCNTGMVHCIKRVQMELAVEEIKSHLDEDKHTRVSEKEAEARDIAANCKCMPACTSIEYEMETSQASYDWKAIYRAYKLNISKADEELMYSRVMIFFKEPQFITSRRSELYGQTDFLANCGGLLGLFMGFSILSVAEILYFLTLRLCCILYQRREYFKKLKLRENGHEDPVKPEGTKISDFMPVERRTSLIPEESRRSSIFPEGRRRSSLFPEDRRRSSGRSDKLRQLYLD